MSSCIASSNSPDIPEIKMGMQRSDVETVLGQPLREKRDNEDQIRCIYVYLVGVGIGYREVMLTYGDGDKLIAIQSITDAVVKPAAK
jgi:hypothetical protein